MTRQELVTKVESLGFKPSRYLCDCTHNATVNDDNYYYLWLCEVQRWLIQVHNISISVETGWDNNNHFIFTNIVWSGYNDASDYAYVDTYIEALELGIKESFNLIKV